jgi:hypothetical protein
MNNSVAFSTFTMFGSHYLSSLKYFYHTKKKNKSECLPLISQPLVSSSLLLVSWTYLVWILHRNGITHYVDLGVCLLSLRAHPYQCFFLFYEWTVFYHTYYILLMYSPIEGYVVCILLFFFFFFLDGVHSPRLAISFWELGLQACTTTTPGFISIFWPNHFTSPLANYRVSISLHPHQYYYFHFFTNGHFSGFLMYPIVVWVPFPSWLMTLIIYSYAIGHSYILFEGIFI